MYTLERGRPMLSTLEIDLDGELPAWAHVRIDDETGGVVEHELGEHLHCVAELAMQFAAPDARDIAHLAGIWHDLGKYRPGFRAYIRQANGVDAHIEGRVKDHDKTHSAAGAIWAAQALQDRFGPKGLLMARALQYVIAGHHAGLANWNDGDTSVGLVSRLANQKAQTEYQEAVSTEVPSNILVPAILAARLQPILPPSEQRDGQGRFALWVRMLFSSLVDADFLDTERFLDHGKASVRDRSTPSMQALQQCLVSSLATLMRSCPPSPVNRLRADVLTACRHKALLPPGVFTLSVPPGGGKTLASLAFALDHAVVHGRKRVIYAIPYTSIIEQTADNFRKVFASLGDDVLVEHHSNAESSASNETARSRLASDNWDAPLVVTTTVQLFESLYASRTSRCRKLHNLMNSVVVLDEAQLLPTALLQPIVDVLRLLVDDYGVTLLLCTATQPDLSASLDPDLMRGLKRGFNPARITEIIDDVSALYSGLQRVRVHLPADFEAPVAWPVFAAEAFAHPAVLVIVDRRDDARTLFKLMQSMDLSGSWHLSALMCPQHRSEVIKEIKAALIGRREALAGGGDALPVRVVSTQLIEAGVDLDFPVVYRAMAGLDSIAQAAGRCNREGLMSELGDVHVFVPPTPPAAGSMLVALTATKVVCHDRPENPLVNERMRRYFKRIYHDQDLDHRKICDMVTMRADAATLSFAVNFRDAAEAFRMIDDDTAVVIVRYAGTTTPGVDVLLSILERVGPKRWLMRKLQRYAVNVRRYRIKTLVEVGSIRELPACPGLYVQEEGVRAFYDPRLGVVDDGVPSNASAFVA